MAEKTEGTITIDASPAQVMEVITDFEAYPEWAQGMKKGEILDKGDDGRGTKVRFEVSMMGINGWYILSYVYEPADAGVVWTFQEGSPLKDLSGEYHLRAEGDGTFVTYLASLDPGIPMVGFMKRKVEKTVIDTALKGLKKRVESL